MLFMRRIICIMLLAGMVPFAGFSDVDFKMRLDHSELLQYEPVYVYLSLFNDSDQPFIINCDDKNNITQINFRVTRMGEEVTRLHPSRQVIDNLSVMPDEKRELMIEISKWYDMDKMGKYVVTPILTDINGKFEGQKSVLDVVYGGRLDKVTKSAPGHYNGECTYQLLYWNRGGLERLFLRVDSSEGYSYDVVEIGTLIRIVPPKINVDRKGNIEILHQSQPTTYLRTLFKIGVEGLVFIEQTAYQDEVSPPQVEKPQEIRSKR